MHLARTSALALLLLVACRSEHGLDKPPPGYREPPPRAQVKQSYDPKTGRLAHEYTELVYGWRRPVKDGREVKFAPNGEKLWEGTWKNGEKVGAWRFYYASGAPKSETFYGDARTPTTMTFWHENGQPSLQGPAINGVRQGTWRVWRKNGLLAEEGNYAGSLREGAWKVYGEDGRTVSEVLYSRNVRVSAGAPEACDPIWSSARPAPAPEPASPLSETKLVPADDPH